MYLLYKIQVTEKYKSWEIGSWLCYNWVCISNASSCILQSYHCSGGEIDIFLAANLFWQNLPVFLCSSICSYQYLAYQIINETISFKISLRCNLLHLFIIWYLYLHFFCWFDRSLLILYYRGFLYFHILPASGFIFIL